jgi:hypothetical protein
MNLNIKESAKFVGVSRSTIYARLADGKLSKTHDNMLEVSELLRVFGHPEDRNVEHKKTTLDSIKNTPPVNPEVEFLKEKIRFLESNLSEAKTREEWLKGQVDKLTEAVKLLEPPKVEAREESNAETKQEKKGFLSRFLS